MIDWTLYEHYTNLDVIVETGELNGAHYDVSKHYAPSGDDYKTDFVTDDGDKITTYLQRVDKEDFPFIISDYTYNVTFQVNGSENADDHNGDLSFYIKIVTTISLLVKQWLEHHPKESVIFFASDDNPKKRRQKFMFMNNIFDKIVSTYYNKKVVSLRGIDHFYLYPMNEKEKISEDRSIALTEYLIRKRTY